jgi:preprotein translocase subunit YajC
MQIFDDFLNFFINSAYADTAAPAQQSSGFPLIMMTGVFILFMYFVMWRPQSKRAKDHRNLLNSLSKGDEVVTAGGILGKISKVNENHVLLALTDNLEITVQKSSIANALPKGTLKSIA